jgi:hypothetical protein
LSLDATTLPVENVPVGRLVNTPTEIAGIIQDYLTNSTITPKSTLATGYSFMEPAAQTIAGDFAAGNQQAGAENDTLLDGGTAPGTDTDWTAADLQSELQTPHQLVFLGAHFNENGAEAADGSALWTSQLSLGSNLQNSLVISAGCHSGYAVDRADAVNGLTGLPSWPEEFASAGATLIAGTGYQYGDSNYTAYSDQYYVDLAGQLAGRTVSVGGAMLQSQYQYLADLDGLNSLTEKSLLEVTLYGLPMLKITTGGGQSAAQTTPGVFTLPGTGNTAPTSTVPSGPGNALGLYEADVTVPTASLTQGSVDQAGTTLTYDSGQSGVVANPGQAVVPVQTEDVAYSSPSGVNQVLRGVGFLGGSYLDTGTTATPVTPLTGDPVTETYEPAAPFVSSSFYPETLSNAD